jgi:hypothetical protein
MDDRTKTGNSNTERVGYSNPPKHTRFKTGQSGILAAGRKARSTWPPRSSGHCARR